MSNSPSPLLEIEALRSQYLERTNAPAAATLLRSLKTDTALKKVFDLPHLLRHHSQELITEPIEVFLRDAFDDLVDYYTLLEVAASAGVIPTPIPASIAEPAKFELSYAAFRQYYTSNYVVALMPAFHERLTSEVGFIQRGGTRVQELYFEFLMIRSRLVNHPNIDTFMWFLEDGYEDGEGLPALIALVKNKARFERHWSLSRKSLTGSGKALDGFTHFLVFAFELDRFLLRMKRYPALREKMWLYYSYWFKATRTRLMEFTESLIPHIEGVVSRRNPTLAGLTHAEWKGHSNIALSRVLWNRYGVQSERGRSPNNTAKFRKNR